MEGMRQFMDFTETIEDDSRIGMTHISLYLALLYEYIRGSSQLPIYADRERLLQRAKMCRKTYNKSMKELQEYGYISYKPSCDPCKKSQVFLKRL